MIADAEQVKLDEGVSDLAVFVIARTDISGRDRLCR